MTSTPRLFGYIVTMLSAMLPGQHRDPEGQGGKRMDAAWVADRSYLRQVRREYPQWSAAQLAEVTGRSVSWIKKWKQRLMATSGDDEQVLFSQSRARQHPPTKVSEPVVAAILAIREQPP